MMPKQEGILRLAQRRRSEIGTLSDEAFAELLEAVKKNPDAFITTEEDRAYMALGAALAAYENARAKEEFLDELSYERARNKRNAKLASKCRRVLEIDPECIDAKTIEALVTYQNPGDVLEQLLALDEGLGPIAGTISWDDTLCRPRLRLKATIARAMLETTRFRAVIATCNELLELEPTDVLGARYTLSLAYARLEDEEAFNKLDARFGHIGNAWSHIARTLLLFKLGRWQAAARALRGYGELCQGGAYALVRPVLMEGYLPDRPAFKPGTFEEASLAVGEADPIIVDTPDFISWVYMQESFVAGAQKFASKHGLEW